MSKIQHELAHQLIPIIRQANTHNELLTYQMAAKKLGRPINNARAIAQVCDLIDAAAALAGTPLLALVAVRVASGKINPKAWKEISIINCSLNHKFSDEDFSSIKKSLDELEGYGNHRAWAEVRKKFPDEQQLIKRLSLPGTKEQGQSLDAINDLETDSVEKITTSTTIYSRDRYIREAVLKHAQGKCEYCKKAGFDLPNGRKYLEAHHIIALAKNGPDRLTNLIALCANHHREAHYGALKQRLEAEMMSIVKERKRIQI